MQLNDVLDKDGLAFCNRLSKSNGRIFCDNKEVFVSPECRGVAQYIVLNENLWQASRLRVNDTEISLKRAPIIGVSFSDALKKAISSKGKLQKSLFQVQDWTKFKGKAVIASLLAYTKEEDSFIEFHAWQILDISDETFYIHAHIEKSLSYISHIDGATQFHSYEERMQLSINGKRIDGCKYTKHFRLDGHLNISVVEDLLRLYFPVQPLTREFLNAIQDDQ